MQRLPTAFPYSQIKDGAWGNFFQPYVPSFDLTLRKIHAKSAPVSDLEDSGFPDGILCTN